MFIVNLTESQDAMAGGTATGSPFFFSFLFFFSLQGQEIVRTVLQIHSDTLHSDRAIR